MRLSRLALFVFCLIFLPIILMLFSAFSSSSQVMSPNAIAGPKTGLHALFSFNIPSSLFPPSAVISLTDDNSTFFLARPAAFGPLLPEKGLSGQLWVGSGFGETPATSAVGELGCSDIPGWRDDTGWQDMSPFRLDNRVKNPRIDGGKYIASQSLHGTDSQHDSGSQNRWHDHDALPSIKDGTDDHLHPSASEWSAASGASKKYSGSETNHVARADIQSLQESAEIDGKVVLLRRGGCGFLEKIKWVQRRGGTALIVGDDTRGGGLVTMYARGDTSNITIPSVFTSHTTAQLLSSLVPPPAGDLKLDDGPKDSSGTRLSAQGSLIKQGRAAASAMPVAVVAYSSIVSERIEDAHVAKTGILHNLLSFLGLCGSNERTQPLSGDSRRQPGNANTGCAVIDSLDEERKPLDDMKNSAGSNHEKSSPGNSVGGFKDIESQKLNDNSDELAADVQDLRDRDFIMPNSNTFPRPSRRLDSEASEQLPSYASTYLERRGSTAECGENRIVEPGNDGSSDKGFRDTTIPSHPTSSAAGKSWFSRHLTWNDRTHDISQSASSEIHRADSAKPQMELWLNRRMVKSDSHEGLWVTLAPTSMSTSPFFDTLLVLVVSPLITLTVVYVLLHLRARIRRRRWRAPKSVVDRLPVRTYRAIVSSPSSSSASSARSVSPRPALPTSPLLNPGSRAAEPLLRPRSQAMSEALRSIAGLPNIISLRRENPCPRASRYQRKYTGRQEECVVCLEEYVDGLSRVMSLPCGHEFHAECITPWLTTRRRTCPICKGDVVRSMSSRNTQPEPTDTASAPSRINLYHGASSAPVQMPGLNEDGMLDMERRAGSGPDPSDGHASSSPPSSWRNIASFSFSALNDKLWSCLDELNSHKIQLYFASSSPGFAFLGFRLASIRAGLQSPYCMIECTCSLLAKVFQAFRQEHNVRMTSIDTEVITANFNPQESSEVHSTFALNALKSEAYLYPLKGVIYFAAHRSLWPPLLSRAVPTAVLGVGITMTMFTLTYIPQATLLAFTSGPFAPVSAALLILSESSAITVFLARSFLLRDALVDTFDRTLIMKGKRELVYRGREKDSLSTSDSRSDRELFNLSVISKNALLYSLLYLPLNVIPVVGTALYLFVQGRRTGPAAHRRYFELKGWSPDSKKSAAWIERFWPAYISFGAMSTALELVPFFSLVFAFTNTIGAALWAADLEDLLE